MFSDIVVWLLRNYVRIFRANLGGKIGIILGIILAVFIVIDSLSSWNRYPHPEGIIFIVPIFFAFIIPILGIVGAILGAIVKFIVKILTPVTKYSKYIFRVDAYFKKGDFDLTIAECTKAIQCDSSHPAAYGFRGMAYAAKGDFDNAVADFTETIRREPNPASLYFRRACAYSHSGHVQKAIRDFEKFLELDPNNVDAVTARETLTALRLRLSEQKRKEEDEKDYFTDKRDGQKYRIVKIGGQMWMAENLNYNIDNSWSYDNDESNGKKYGRLYTWSAAMVACLVGWRLSTNDDWDKLLATVGDSSVAAKNLKAAHGWNSDRNCTDHYGFSALPGGFRVINGNFNGIGNYGNFWTAIEYDSENAYIRSIHNEYSNLGAGKFKKGYGFSVRCVQEYRGKKANSASEYFDSGRAYPKKDEYGMAMTDFNNAKRLDPNNWNAYLERGNMYFDKADWDMAIADYNEAIRLNPNYAGAYCCRGNAYTEKDEPDRAIADYNEAIRLDHSSAGSYWARGLVYGGKGDQNRAIADFNEAIRLDPFQLIYYRNRGDAYVEKGDHDKAIADYTQAIRVNPNYEAGYFLRGISHVQLDHVQEAIRDFEKYLGLTNDSETAEFVRNTLWALRNGKIH